MKVRHLGFAFPAVCLAIAVARSASAAVVFANDFNAATAGVKPDSTTIPANGPNSTSVTLRSGVNTATTIVDRGNGNLALQFTDNTTDPGNPRAYSPLFASSSTATGDNRLTGSFDYTRLLTDNTNATSPIFQLLVSSGGNTSASSATAAVQLAVEASGRVSYLNGGTPVDSGVVMTTGTEYTFAIDADFSSATQDTWSFTVTPVGSATPILSRTGINMRAANVTANIITFQGGANGGAVNAAAFSQVDNISFSTSTVPEPASAAFLALTGLGLTRRKR